MIARSTAAGASTIVARVDTDEQSARRIADLFAESFAADDVAVSIADAGSGNWHVAIHFGGAPDRQSVRALATIAAGAAAAAKLRFERIAATDWVGKSLAGLKPVQAGRFVIHGAHDRPRVPLNCIGIEIEAALAFGTGHHATTRGCLLALDRIGKLRAKPLPIRNGPPRRAMPGVLDLGTGSGVLAIAAARALRQSVLASDIDAAAVRVARANARRNRVAGMVAAVQADGISRRAISTRAPYAIVLANILLRPLQQFAAPLMRLLAPGARVILSGLLSSQANAAIAAYRPLALERRIELDGWTTLVLKR